MPDDDSRLYFSRGADIMYADKINGQYIEPVALPSNINSELSESHPEISRDGQRLYFNRLGLYYRPDTTMVSYVINGNWQDPIPLNGNINCTHSPYCPMIPCSSYGPSFTASGTKMYYTHFNTFDFICEGYCEIWSSELTTDLDDNSPSIPELFSLSAYPNPFNGSTNISISGNPESFSEIAIYDITGRRIKTFAQAQQIIWDGTDNRGMTVSSGIYFLRAMMGNSNQSLKITYLR